MRQQHTRRPRSAPRTSRPQPASRRRPSIADMTPDELRAWIGSTRAALQEKMVRERAYLDRRAARGTYTPTDEALETDQLLQVDLLEMLTEFEQVTWRMDA